MMMTREQTAPSLWSLPLSPCLDYKCQQKTLFHRFVFSSHNSRSPHARTWTMTGSGDDEDELREAREARVAAQAGSKKRLVRRIVCMSVLESGVLYLCILPRGKHVKKHTWNPPLDSRALYDTLVGDYSVSAGLLDIACLAVWTVLYNAVVLSAATPCDRRRALLSNVRLVGVRARRE